MEKITIGDLEGGWQPPAPNQGLGSISLVRVRVCCSQFVRSSSVLQDIKRGSSACVRACVRVCVRVCVCVCMCVCVCFVVLHHIKLALNLFLCRLSTKS